MPDPVALEDDFAVLEVNEVKEKSPPLWLPTGSIRAILALVVVIMAMVMFALNRQVPDSLGIIVTAVIVYYFQKPSSGA